MSNASAREYAESIAADIRRMVEAGAPFGWKNVQTDEWHDNAPDIDADDADDYFPASAFDWLGDVLDIQYLVNRDREYRSARVCIAYGGPTAWIDTRTGMLECAWWSAVESVELPSEFIDALDDTLSELYGDY